MNETATEFFTRVNKIEDEYERAKTLWDNGSTRVRDFIYYALSPNVKWLLPEGEPPYNEADTIRTHPNIWAEVRRLHLFVEGGLKPSNLNEGKRQMSFIQSLEYVHPDDAKLLIAIKEGKWPFDNINAAFVNRIWPGLISEAKGE